MRVIRGGLLGSFGHARDITGVYAGRVELTGAERAVAWLGLAAAVAVLLVSVDLLTGGRLFGRPPGQAAADTEAAEDE
jgi:hypothetical protein